MNEMFRRIINSKSIIKLQERNEKELSENEKIDCLNEIFKNSKKKFLEKFSQHLIPEDVCLFEINSNDNDRLFIEYYLKRICEPMNKKSAKVKNRRYEALQRLIKRGEYFDDESMKSREPLLYEQMIGKYEDTKNHTSAAITSESGLHLTDFLMKHLENVNHEDRLKRLKCIENEQTEETDEDTDDDEPEREEEEEEKEEDEELIAGREQMRDEFITIMHRKFLNGEDSNVDYNSIDYNDDYDNIEIESRDLEEKYFDDDDDDSIKIDNETSKNWNDFDY